MNKRLITSFLVVFLVLPLLVFAVDFPDPFPGGTPPDSFSLVIRRVIDRIFGYIWLFFIAFAVIMFIRAGFMYLTAGGEPGKVKSASGSLLWGIIGVAVAMLAFTIPWIIFEILN